MLSKEIFGYLSLAATVVGAVPYLVSILRGKTKPHIFTYIIWSAMTSIAAAGQYVGGAGPGAWATILAAIFGFAVIGLAWRYGEKNITRSDWISLIIGLSAIPLWAITKNPLPAVLLATLIDASGYYPTFRKSYMKPHEELAYAYIVSNVKHLLSILALDVYSMTTLFFPAFIFMMNCSLVIMLLVRRRAIKLATPGA